MKKDDTAFYPVVLTDQDKDKLAQAKVYLLENIDCRTSIADLSRILGINRNKLTAGFKQLNGTTILDFLIDERMEKAKELLLYTDMPIQEIATAVGYSKLSNFTTAFTRKFDVSPSTFRRKKA